MGKNEKTGLGRALVKHHNQMIRQSKERGRFYNSLHTKVLESITEVSNKDAVIEQAEEADRLFSFQHPAPNLPISLDTSLRTSDMTPDQLREQQKKEEVLHASSLRVPRSLEENEKLVLTPFEKNLDIWRQLWRVVERSDLLVMVVDARDPFFYCCPDLEKERRTQFFLPLSIYAHEVDEHKRTLLLINKADLLPFSVRQKWAEYFRHQGILFIFWSAKAASVAIEGKKLKELWKEQATHETNDDPDIKIYGRDELLSQLQSQAEDIVKMRGKFGSGTIGPSNAQSQGVNFAGNLAPMNVVVGFVGYPNVGKSSTINALVGQKWAGVTSTPGKTKHFQTLKISEELTLCDCPGLVFPSFTSSRYEMIASGVLPIDRMTEHREAVQIVSNHVSRHIIEDVYKIKLPKPKAYVSQSRPPLASELLRAYCASRGYVASSGLPDETRAARQILKDYIDGKLPHYEMPPGMFSEEPSVEDDGGPRLSEMCESDSSDTENHPDIEGENAPILEHVLDDISLFDETNGLVSKKITVKKPNASHKHHKKSPRKKDRSWRIRNDDGDGMPLSLPKVCECRYYPA